MKIKNLMLLGIMVILASCGVENIENLGLSDCAFEYKENLDKTEDYYQDKLWEPDSAGNSQSLELCLHRRTLTKQYLHSLSLEQDYNNIVNSGEGCTEEEIAEFDEQIGKRIQELEEDLEDVWSRCEELYGDD